MFDFTIAPDNREPFEVTATSRDIARWERTNKGASVKALADEMRFTDLYKVAYLACSRTGLWDGDEKSFVDQCDIVIAKPPKGEEDDDADPTNEEA